MKILVIEDESLLRCTITKKLEKEGHEVIGCSDGLIGLKEIVKHRPDMVITDVMIPRRNGMEVVHFIREKLKSDIPIIIISFIGVEDAVIEGFDLGIDDYITKPFSLNEMIIRINKAFKCKGLLN